MCSVCSWYHLTSPADKQATCPTLCVLFVLDFFLPVQQISKIPVPLCVLFVHDIILPVQQISKLPVPLCVLCAFLTASSLSWRCNSRWGSSWWCSNSTGDNRRRRVSQELCPLARRRPCRGCRWVRLPRSRDKTFPSKTSPSSFRMGAWLYGEELTTLRRERQVWERYLKVVVVVSVEDGWSQAFPLTDWLMPDVFIILWMSWSVEKEGWL